MLRTSNKLIFSSPRVQKVLDFLSCSHVCFGHDSKKSNDPKKGKCYANHQSHLPKYLTKL